MKASSSTSKRLVSKFIATYEKLFNGFSPHEISPHETPEQFWSNLLSLNVDRAYLGRQLRAVRKEEALTVHKPFLNTLISTCLYHLRTVQNGDARKANACETLTLVVRCLLEKHLAGWEVMEVFAGGVGESDAVFLDFARTIDTILSDASAPPDLKHQALQLATVFTCGINQLSPGAYFLRQNLYPAIVSIIKSPATQTYTFDAALLLAVLANFHRSDAAKLNPYLQVLCTVENREVLRSVGWAAAAALEDVVRAYQAIADDSPPTFISSVSSLIASFRPDRALASAPADAPRELFKNQPIEKAVILLPIHDLMYLNARFSAMLVEPLLSPESQPQSSPQAAPQSDSRSEPTPLVPPTTPLLYTLLTVSSYILTHAGSVSSQRATAYAHMCLASLLYVVENDVIMAAFVQEGGKSGKGPVRLCRQRLPLLPLVTGPCPCLTALLDCCVLWLRHNLHKKLEAQSYITCIWIVHRVVWFLSRRRYRLDYHWEELWRALVALLDFISSRLGGGSAGGKVEQLVQETIVLLAFSLRHAESFLGTPRAVHLLVYELVRAIPVLQKQRSACQRFTPSARHAPALSAHPVEALKRLIDSAGHYEKIVQSVGRGSGTGAGAGTVLRAIAKEVERDGLVSGVGGDDDVQKRSDELGELGFVRYACADGLALMPGAESI